MQSYSKAQKEINAFSGKPLSPEIPYYIDTEGEIGFVEFVPIVLERLFRSICLDYPDGHFAEVLMNIKLNIEERMDISVEWVFHLGLLLDHADLFTQEEHNQYLADFHGLVRHVSLSCISYSDFYQTYFASTFFIADKDRYERFRKQMDYSFVFYLDIHSHATEDFGPDFMGEIVSFGQEYTRFYENMIHEIQQRKQVHRLAIT